MWAVVEIAKKQYVVRKGDVLAVERLSGEGDIVFDKVLLRQTDSGQAEIGTPYVKGLKVKAKIIQEEKADKVTVYKYKRRKKYRKKTGHRQILTLLKISDIVKSK